VDAKGRLDMDQLQKEAEGAALGCFMVANNEIGNIYPVRTIGKVLRQNNCRFLCDASQAIGKIPLSIKQMKADYLIFSGHKIHAMQGIGCLVLTNKNENIHRLCYGGAQQSGRRSGTLNVPGIYSMGLAIDDIRENSKEDNLRMVRLRDTLWAKLQDGLANGIQQTGDLENKLPNNLHFCIPGIDNTAVMAKLQGKVSLSTGSACSTGYQTEPSKVLKAMALPPEYIRGAFRIGLSKFTTSEEISIAATRIISAAS